MKRLLLSNLILFAAIIVTNAQVQQGDSNIGLNTTLSTQTGVDQGSTQFNLNAFYEIYITDNISLGAGPSLTVSGSDGNTNTGVGINMFGNYNFLTSNGVILPYAGALLNVFVIGSTFDSPNGEFTTTITNTGIGFKGGMKIFVTERVNIDTNLSYTTTIGTSVVIDGQSFDTAEPEGGLLQLFAGIGIILGKRGS